jgi:hypothetical protein
MGSWVDRIVPAEGGHRAGRQRVREGLAYRPRLLEEQGCGALTAALLIGRTAGAQRFRSDACFGRQSGTAPIPCSSGQRTQHRLDRGGDRRLNRALHTIAITRAQHDPTTKEYLAREQAEGKTKKGALRCLKRYLARRFWRLLAEPPLEPEQAASGEPTNAPAEPEPPTNAPAEPEPPTNAPAEPEPLAIPERPTPRREVDRTITGAIPMVCIT